VCHARYSTGPIVPLATSPNVNRPGWEGSVYADFNPNIDLSGSFDAESFNLGQQNAPSNLFFNRAAFSNPGNCKLGNGKRRYQELCGFGWSIEDTGIMKYWRIVEGFSMQLRAELLNVFNRHRFADPNTGLGNQTNFGYLKGMTIEPRNVQV
jgi:hypothetical protein